jgi:hypothetical protein
MTIRKPPAMNEARVNPDTAAMLADVEARGYVDPKWADVILANNRRAAAEEAEPEQLPDAIGGECCPEEGTSE